MYHLTFLEVRSLKWVSRAASLLEAVEENLFSCLSQLLEAACLHWPVTTQHSDLYCCCHISSVTLLPPSSILYLPHDYIDPTNVIHDSFPISKSLINHAYKILMSCKVTYSQIPGIRMWTSLGGHYSDYHTQDQAISWIWQILSGPLFWKEDGK